MTKDEENVESAGSAGVGSMEYEEFHKYMEVKYPKMYGGFYGGFACGRGWWKMLDVLSNNIQRHIDFRNAQYEKFGRGEPVAQVVVEQVKEKFGGLRFYYQGGDEYINGLVSMTESVSDYTCEECGSPGKKSGKGWIRTLCDIHSIP